jgi:K+-transporting ATPase ATPase C chain
MNYYLRPALALLLVFTLATGVLYPLVVTGIALALFPSKAKGSLIESDGRAKGSELIGQPFHGPEYFWGRLSATVPTPFNSAASSGSNYGPINPALLDATKERLARLHDADLSNTRRVPVDLVTSSGSGLDPHISVAAALYQVPRVARERGTPEENIRTLVNRFTESPDLGFLGESRVNVLKLNLALDAMGTNPKGAN